MSWEMFRNLVMKIEKGHWIKQNISTYRGFLSFQQSSGSHFCLRFSKLLNFHDIQDQRSSDHNVEPPATC